MFQIKNTKTKLKLKTELPKNLINFILLIFEKVNKKNQMSRAFFSTKNT